jgi:glycosyltransferase involved in cell wall biosynthesis
MDGISVIVANYNRASMIGETLRSILSQTRVPDEIIVVDDGSTDESRDVIRAFGPRIRLIEQENSGPAVARNRGLAVSNGEFIQFMDSDDLCAHNKLDEQIAALLRTGADMAYAPYVKCSLQNGIAWLSGPAMQLYPLPAKRSPAQWFTEGWGIYLQACLFRRSTLLKAGRFRENLMPTEDYELLFRILLTKPRIVHVSSTCFVYRLHPNGQISFQSALSSKRSRDYVNYAVTILGHIREHESQFRVRDQWHWWIEVMAARGKIARSDGFTKLGQLVPVLGGVLPILWKQACSLAWQFSRKFHGRVYRLSFGEGPVSSNMTSLIQELGYEIRHEKQQVAS